MDERMTYEDYVRMYDTERLNPRQFERFQEWYYNSEHADLGEGGFQDALMESFLKGWEEATATFRDLLEQVNEDLYGVN